MTKVPNMARIAEAIRRHHGGLEAADDVQLKRVWDALPETIQQAYLDELSQAKKSETTTPKT